MLLTENKEIYSLYCFVSLLQKDKVVRHRQLSSLDVFLETAKQQLTMIMEDNQNDTGASKLQEEKKDET